MEGLKMESSSMMLFFLLCFVLLVVAYLSFLIEYRKHQHLADIQNLKESLSASKEREIKLSKQNSDLCKEVDFLIEIGDHNYLLMDKIYLQMKFLSDRNIQLEYETGKVPKEFAGKSEVIILYRQLGWDKFLEKLQTSK